MAAKLSTRRPEFIRSGPLLSEARLAEVEAQYGIRLPAAYRSFMLERNGGEPEPSGVCRKRRKTPEMNCDCLFSIDAEDDCENWVSIYESMKVDEVVLPSRLIPIGDDSGNRFLISVSGKDAGKVYWWNHEDFFVPDPPDRVTPDMTGISVVADSFENFLGQFAEIPDETPELKPGNWVALFKERDRAGIKTWLEAGGKWDECDPKSGRNPLMLAIELGDLGLVECLLTHGASAQEAIQHAIQVSKWKIVHWLASKSTVGAVCIDSFMFAHALEGCDDASVIERLLDLGAPIHGEHFGHNPLYSATLFKCNPGVIKLLLDRGAKLEQSAAAQSALANAIANGKLQAVKLLLDAGEDLYKDPQKTTQSEEKFERLLKQEQAKAVPDKAWILTYTQFLEHERKINKPKAPVFSFDQPWKKHPVNFKKDVIAYAAKLG